ncbi:hypothetical protein AMIS_14410 [Actinoplanes missouriensis 431]|uniref:Uncharacterized protein n=1 Tax=Actinoplanes missouriensis (strain ATCC 14538 / DSM 43046 / CBS 188.64 / JCM 3121 / NBRC 102363 / NCIMB 12654 / NRRL B-3342 / UNCC 431) TaxID=512565 RepID=I0H0X4_ACTM4|nr:hypothetical protein [Actinoplanes missouriensis]BAL86661.1 hypothetical protein AMIS_14410 [Actinoplanes missouriensis 431]
MAGSARDEAERLVATFLAKAAAGGLGAAASASRASGDSPGTGDADPLRFLGETVAGFLHSSRGWATGSAECCVCPICRAITALRDPSPETAERLATSAGEIATGVAGLMRAFSSLTEQRPKPPPAQRSSERPANPDSVWASATHAAQRAGGGEDSPDAGDDPWAAATAESAREAAAAARARAAAAEEAVARAVAAATAARERASQERESRTGGGWTPEHGGMASTRTRTGDVWASAIAQTEAAAEAKAASEAAAIAEEHSAAQAGSAAEGHSAAQVEMAAEAEAGADDAARHRSVDHVRGAVAPEDRDGAGPGDGARRGDAV